MRLFVWMLDLVRPAPRSCPQAPSAGERDPLGPAGEREARRYLHRRGFRMLGANVRVPAGEADLVFLAPDRRTIVLVEVKTRRIGGTGTNGHAPSVPPEVAVHARKQRTIAAIGRYLARSNRWKDRPIRVDVIGIDWPPTGRPAVRHHVGIMRLA